MVNSMKNNILEVLKDKHEAQTLIQINDLLGLSSAEELKQLELTLEELVNEYKVFKTKKDKYILYDNAPGIKVGKLSVNKAGNGFLLQEGEDIYIDYCNLNSAIDGDEVLVELIKYKGKEEGRVVKILNRNTKNIIGEILFKDKKPTLILDDKKKKITVELDPNTTNNCVDGTKVVVNLVKEKSRNNYIGKVVSVSKRDVNTEVVVETTTIQKNCYVAVIRRNA